MNARRAWVAVVLVLGGCGGAPAADPRTPSPDPAPSASLTQAEAPPPPDVPVAKSVGLPHMIPGTSIEFLGGDGSSQKQAVLIHGAKGEKDGIDAEYKYIEMIYGPEGERWNRDLQSLVEDNGRYYDELDFPVGRARTTLYFDITEYYGKF